MRCWHMKRNAAGTRQNWHPLQSGMAGVSGIKLGLQELWLGPTHEREGDRVSFGEAPIFRPESAANLTFTTVLFIVQSGKHSKPLSCDTGLRCKEQEDLRPWLLVKLPTTGASGGNKGTNWVPTTCQTLRSFTPTGTISPSQEPYRVSYLYAAHEKTISQGGTCPKFHSAEMVHLGCEPRSP